MNTGSKKGGRGKRSPAGSFTVVNDSQQSKERMTEEYYVNVFIRK
jgi:hypothetical protein